MSERQETVEDIVRELRDDANKVADEQHDEDCWTNLEAMQIYDSLASRIESAWRREKAELTNIIYTECNHCGDCAKFGTDCNAGDVDGAEDNRACEKFVSKEVAELKKRQCPKNFKCDSLTEMLYDTRRENSELRLSLSAEKARHTPDYKDERIRAQDEEIATLKRENAELRKCMKEACAAVCSGVLTGCKGTLAYGSRCCLAAECEYHKWRKSLEGANAPVSEGGEK